MEAIAITGLALEIQKQLHKKTLGALEYGTVQQLTIIHVANGTALHGLKMQQMIKKYTVQETGTALSGMEVTADNGTAQHLQPLQQLIWMCTALMVGTALHGTAMPVTNGLV